MPIFYTKENDINKILAIYYRIFPLGLLFPGKILNLLLILINQ